MLLDVKALLYYYTTALLYYYTTTPPGPRCSSRATRRSRLLYHSTALLQFFTTTTLLHECPNTTTQLLYYYIPKPVLLFASGWKLKNYDSATLLYFITKLLHAAGPCFSSRATGRSKMPWPRWASGCGSSPTRSRLTCRSAAARSEAGQAEPSRSRAPHRGRGGQGRACERPPTVGSHSCNW